MFVSLSLVIFDVLFLEAILLYLMLAYKLYTTENHELGIKPRITWETIDLTVSSIFRDALKMFSLKSSYQLLPQTNDPKSISLRNIKSHRQMINFRHALNNFTNANLSTSSMFVYTVSMTPTDWKGRGQMSINGKYGNRFFRTRQNPTKKKKRV